MTHGPAYAIRWTRRGMRLHLYAHHITGRSQTWIQQRTMPELHAVHEAAHQRGDLMPDHRDIGARTHHSTKGDGNG